MQSYSSISNIDSCIDLKSSCCYQSANSSYVHAMLLQADPSPAPCEGWLVPVRIANPAEMCGPIQSHCQEAAANQRAPPRDWTTAPPGPRTGTPDPAERRGGGDTLMSRQWIDRTNPTACIRACLCYLLQQRQVGLLPQFAVQQGVGV